MGLDKGWPKKTPAELTPFAEAAIPKLLPRLAPNSAVSAAEFGLPVPATAVHRLARLAVPFRFFDSRGSRWHRLDTFAGHVPDAALLRYADALESGLFRHFYVVVPERSSEMPVMDRSDPWLVASVHDVGTDYKPSNWQSNSG